MRGRVNRGTCAISHTWARSHCLLTHDWQGDQRHLQAYVTSAIFPDAVDRPSVDRSRQALRRMIDACLDYGIEPSLWITELPCQGGPWVPDAMREAFLTRYPEEVLSDSGTYEGKVLCFGHPKVQAFYRDLLARFFKRVSRDFRAVSVRHGLGRGVLRPRDLSSLQGNVSHRAAGPPHSGSSLMKGVRSGRGCAF